MNAFTIPAKSIYKPRAESLKKKATRVNRWQPQDPDKQASADKQHKLKGKL